MSRMKTYHSPTDALIDYLHWLNERGEFNSVELHRRMKTAGTPEDDMISESMFRLMLGGHRLKLGDHRAVAACRAFNIRVEVINAQIPDQWTRKKRKK